MDEKNKLILSCIKYVEDNSNFESNAIINECIEKFKEDTSLCDIFKRPIEHRLFKFSDALEWLFFLKVLEYNIKPRPMTPILDANLAIEYLINTYTLVVEEMLDESKD